MKSKIVFGLGLLLLLLTSCDRKDTEPCADYRQAMRDFVVRICTAARQSNPNFIVIPQNGLSLVTLNDTPEGTLATDYLAAIDGHGQEDLFYGYPKDEMPTPAAETDYLLRYLRRSRGIGNAVFVIDYCAEPEHIADAYSRCDAEGFVSFAAHRRALDQIPSGPIHHENDHTVTSLPEVQNFLFLINPENFSSKEDFIQAVCTTNYDMLVMDLFANDGERFTAAEIERLRQKQNGGKRLVICYMSIGEAENYRYYWLNSWTHHRPVWLERANPQWPGNYKVRYWYSAWQSLICGNGDSYLNRILQAGFDGVYLDIVDAYEYFEGNRIAATGHFPRQSDYVRLHFAITHSTSQLRT